MPSPAYRGREARGRPQGLLGTCAPPNGRRTPDARSIRRDESSWRDRAREPSPRLAIYRGSWPLNRRVHTSHSCRWPFTWSPESSVHCHGVLNSRRFAAAVARGFEPASPKPAAPPWGTTRRHGRVPSMPPGDPLGGPATATRRLPTRRYVSAAVANAGDAGPGPTAAPVGRSRRAAPPVPGVVARPGRARRPDPPLLRSAREMPRAPEPWSRGGSCVACKRNAPTRPRSAISFGSMRPGESSDAVMMDSSAAAQWPARYRLRVQQPQSVHDEPAGGRPPAIARNLHSYSGRTARMPPALTDHQPASVGSDSTMTLTLRLPQRPAPDPRRGPWGWESTDASQTDGHANRRVAAGI